MVAGDAERQESADEVDAPFWVKAWNWFVENPLDWLSERWWGWIILWLFGMSVLLLIFG